MASENEKREPEVGETTALVTVEEEELEDAGASAEGTEAGKEKGKRGPKSHQFDPGEAYAWGLVQMSYRVIGGLCGLGKATVQRHMDDPSSVLSTHYRRGMAEGNKSLRATQFRLAKAGNVPLLIWLGKQRLGQTDKKELDLNMSTVDSEIKRIAAQYGVPEEEVRATYLRLMGGDLVQ